MAIAVITGTTVAGYLVVRTDQTGTGAAFAAAALPGSRAMAVLEHKRQQMILMDSASHTMHLVGTPKVASRVIATENTGGGGGAGGGAGGGGGSVSVFAGPPPSPGTVKAIAYNMMASFGFDAATQFPCVNNIWTRESNWNPLAENATSGAYGIPQALPGSKMASAGSDWQTDATTQIKWGLGYIKSVYGTPCNAWAFWQAHDYY
jgi:hypothetical protein